jgi:hypothetical protein
MPAPTKKPSDPKFFNNPERWPPWPFLPLVKRAAGRLPNAEDRTAGVPFYGDPMQAYVVHYALVSLFLDTKAESNALPKTEYPTAEALVADGWQVDRN